MEIKRLPQFDSGIANIAEKKQTRTAPSEETPKASDTVELSGGGAAEKGDVPHTVSPEYPVRSEVVRAVTERVSRNDYDKPEIQENVAVSIINSLGGTEPSDGTSASESAHGESERVQSVRARATDGYYDRPDVFDTIAERLIGSQGLTSLLGR